MIIQAESRADRLYPCLTPKPAQPHQRRVFNSHKPEQKQQPSAARLDSLHSLGTQVHFLGLYFGPPQESLSHEACKTRRQTLASRVRTLTTPVTVVADLSIPASDRSNTEGLSCIWLRLPLAPA